MPRFMAVETNVLWAGLGLSPIATLFGFARILCGDATFHGRARGRSRAVAAGDLYRVYLRLGPREKASLRRIRLMLRFGIRVQLPLPLSADGSSRFKTSTELYVRFYGPIFLDGDTALRGEHCGRYMKYVE